MAPKTLEEEDDGDGQAPPLIPPPRKIRRGPRRGRYQQLGDPGTAPIRQLGNATPGAIPIKPLPALVPDTATAPAQFAANEEGGPGQQPGETLAQQLARLKAKGQKPPETLAQQMARVKQQTVAPAGAPAPVPVAGPGTPPPIAPIARVPGVGQQTTFDNALAPRAPAAAAPPVVAAAPPPPAAVAPPPKPIMPSAAPRVAADVTGVAGQPKPIAQLPGQYPKPKSYATSLGLDDNQFWGQVANAAGGMADNPQGVVTAPVMAVAHVAQWLTENAAKAQVAGRGGDPATVPTTVSDKDARDAALMLTAIGLTGPLGSKLTEALSPLIGETAGHIAGHVAASAAGGAAFTPDQPGVGAVIGAPFGLLHPAGKGEPAEAAPEAAAAPPVPVSAPAARPAPPALEVAPEGAAPPAAAIKQPELGEGVKPAVKEAVKPAPAPAAPAAAPPPGDLLARAREVVDKEGNLSIALVSRRLKIGYERAQGLIEQIKNERAETPPASAPPPVIPEKTGSAAPTAPAPEAGKLPFGTYRNADNTLESRVTQGDDNRYTVTVHDLEADKTVPVAKTFKTGKAAHAYAQKAVEDLPMAPAAEPEKPAETAAPVPEEKGPADRQPTAQDLKDIATGKQPFGRDKGAMTLEQLQAHFNDEMQRQNESGIGSARGKKQKEAASAKHAAASNEIAMLGRTIKDKFGERQALEAEMTARQGVNWDIGPFEKVRLNEMREKEGLPPVEYSPGDKHYMWMYPQMFQREGESVAEVKTRLKIPETLAELHKEMGVPPMKESEKAPTAEPKPELAGTTTGESIDTARRMYKYAQQMDDVYQNAKTDLGKPISKKSRANLKRQAQEARADYEDAMNDVADEHGDEKAASVRQEIESAPKPERESLAKQMERIKGEGGKLKPEEAPSARPTETATPADAEPRAVRSGGDEGARPSRAAEKEAKRAAEAAPERAPLEPVGGPTGRADKVRFSDGTSHDITYRVIEARDLQPSHNAVTFEHNPDYPEGVQGREYSGARGKAARDHVITESKRLRPEVLLDAGQGVTEGPPVITERGVAIAGNQRAMMLQRDAKEGIRAGLKVSSPYREALLEKAAHFGIDPEQVRSMQDPVLVRQITDAGIDTKDNAQLARLNQLSDLAPTKAKDLTSEAAGRAKQMQSATDALDHLTRTIGDQSVREYLETKDGAAFVRKLFDDQVFAAQERGSLIGGGGEVTPEGKLAIEHMLRVAAIGDADAVANARPSVLAKLDTSIPSIIRANNAGMTELQPMLQDALDLLNRAHEAGTRVEEYTPLFGEPPSAALSEIAQFLQDANKGSARKGFQNLAAMAEERAAAPGEDMFGQPPESDVAAMRRILKPQRGGGEGDAYGGLASAMRTGEGTVGAGFDRSLIKKLGENMYSGQLPVIATKEGIQNAFDSLARDGSGKVKVNFDSDKHTLTIEDNGAGMTPELMEKEFVDIGGSGKDSIESAGGYGLAKVALFAHAKDIDVTSVTRDAQGNLVMSRLTGSGDDWINGHMKLDSIPLDEEYDYSSDDRKFYASLGLPVGESEKLKSATGTTVKLTLGDMEDMSPYQVTDHLQKVALYSTGPMQLEWKVDSLKGSNSFERGEDTYKVDGKEAMSGLIEKTNVPGAEISFYESKRRAHIGQYGAAVKLEVLNRGLFQFELAKTIEEVPADASIPANVVVDIKPTVSVTEGGYPFTTSREQLKSAAQEAIEKFVGKINSRAAEQTAASLFKALDESPAIANTPYRMLSERSSDVEPELARRIAGRDYSSALSEAADRLLTEIRGLDTQAQSAPVVAGTPTPPAEFYGLAMGKRWLGINISSEGLSKVAAKVGREEDAVRMGQRGNQILLNPFAIQMEVAKRGVWNAPDDMKALALAKQTVATMVHEYAHQAARGHDVKFAGVLTRVAGDATMHMGAWVEEFAAIFREHLSDFLGDFKDVSSEWNNEKAGRQSIFANFGDTQAADRRGLRGGTPGGGDDAESESLARPGGGGRGEGAGPRRLSPLREGAAGSVVASQGALPGRLAAPAEGTSPERAPGVEYRHAGIGITPDQRAALAAGKAAVSEAVHATVSTEFTHQYAALAKDHPEFARALASANAMTPAQAGAFMQQMAERVVEGLDPDQVRQFGIRLALDNVDAEIDRKSAQLDQAKADEQKDLDEGLAPKVKTEPDRVQQMKLTGEGETSEPELSPRESFMRDVSETIDKLEKESTRLSALVPRGVEDQAWFQATLARHKQMVEPMLDRAAVAAGVAKSTFRDPDLSYMRLIPADRMNEALISRRVRAEAEGRPSTKLGKMIAGAEVGPLKIGKLLYPNQVEPRTGVSRAILGQRRGVLESSPAGLERPLAGPEDLRITGRTPGVGGGITGTKTTGSATKVRGAENYSPDYISNIRYDAADKVAKAAHNHIFQAVANAAREGKPDFYELDPNHKAPSSLGTVAFNDRNEIVDSPPTDKDIDPRLRRFAVPLQIQQAVDQYRSRQGFRPIRSLPGRAISSVTSAVLTNPVIAPRHAWNIATNVGTGIPAEAAASGLATSMPLVKTISTLVRMKNVDFDDAATSDRLHRLAFEGALRISDERAGGLLQTGHGILFGKKGADVRARLVASEDVQAGLAKQGIFPGDPRFDTAERKYVVEHVGDYVRGNQGRVNQWLSENNIAPFIAINRAKIGTSLKALVGKDGTIDPSAARRLGLVARSGVGTVAAVAAAQYLLSGHRPDQNAAGHEGDFATGVYNTPTGYHFYRGNPLDAVKMFGKGSKEVYFRRGFFDQTTESTMRVLQNLVYARGGDKISEVIRASVNTGLGMLGPGVGEGFGLATGDQLYMGNDGTFIGGDKKTLPGQGYKVALGRLGGGVTRVAPYLGRQFVGAEAEGDPTTAGRAEQARVYGWIDQKTSEIKRETDPAKRRKMVQDAMKEANDAGFGGFRVRVQLNRAAARGGRPNTAAQQKFNSGYRSKTP